MADDHEDDLDFKPRIDGPIRRNLGLFLAVAAILIVGPALSKMLTSYRGVVLEVRGDDMLVGLMELPPKWMDTIDAESGQIIEKSTWSWSPAPVEPEPIDTKLRDLHARYTLTYEGVIVELLPPPSQGGTTSAVVQTDDGGQEVIKLVAEHLLDAGQGDRVVKKLHSWDPVVVEKATADPAGGAILAPAPGTEPAPAAAP